MFHARTEKKTCSTVKDNLDMNFSFISYRYFRKFYFIWLPWLKITVIVAINTRLYDIDVNDTNENKNFLKVKVASETF